MLTVKVGGVPEHFNYPWYIALKDGAFKEQGINLRWIDCHGGTGEMCQALRRGDIDMAIILTEGIITDIINGNPSHIIQTFVNSPLIWGVHVAHESSFSTVADLKGKTAAISREGSGSHLMAYVNAKNQGWDLNKDLKFKIINNLEGGINALIKGDADYFLWERFTTKPLVDQSIFRKIGECPTPWPCFVIAVRNSFRVEHQAALAEILRIINSYTLQLHKISDFDIQISSRYNQKLEDVRAWLSITKWDQKPPNESVINSVQNQLCSLDIIPEKYIYSHLVQKLYC